MLAFEFDDHPQPEPGVVLAKTLIRLTEGLNLTLAQLAIIIGKSAPALSRTFREPTPTLDPKSKSGELALLLLRAYRALSTILNQDDRAIIHWLNSEKELLQNLDANTAHADISTHYPILILDTLTDTNIAISVSMNDTNNFPKFLKSP